MDETDKTASGFDPNVAAALSYSLGWVTGLLFFATEPHNKFVRFHAMQAMLVFGPACILLMLCASIPFLGWILAPFVLIRIRGRLADPHVQGLSGRAIQAADRGRHGGGEDLNP